MDVKIMFWCIVDWFEMVEENEWVNYFVVVKG